MNPCYYYNIICNLYVICDCFDVLCSIYRTGDLFCCGKAEDISEFLGDEELQNEKKKLAALAGNSSAIMVGSNTRHKTRGHHKSAAAAALVTPIRFNVGTEEEIKDTRDLPCFYPAEQ